VHRAATAVLSFPTAVTRWPWRFLQTVLLPVARHAADLLSDEESTAAATQHRWAEAIEKEYAERVACSYKNADPPRRRGACEIYVRAPVEQSHRAEIHRYSYFVFCFVCRPARFIGQ